MILLKELHILLMQEELFLKSVQTLEIHRSLINENVCFYDPRHKLSDTYKLIYNKKWLFQKLRNLRPQIKEWEDKYKIKILDLTHPDYPASIKSLNNPPVCLFILGSWPQFKNHIGLGIVGRREAKPYTLAWMDKELSLYLQKEKPLVISGGARGVDTKAHQLALLHHCPTLYLMPSGLLNLYPSSLQTQWSSLLQAGACFVSTYHPYAPMKKQNFSDRNLLIAALSSHVLILEAEIRSGTYKTAKYALDLGREIGVVPSFPTDASYSGSLQLLYDGATLLRDSKDIFTFISSSQ